MLQTLLLLILLKNRKALCWRVKYYFNKLHFTGNDLCNNLTRSKLMPTLKTCITWAFPYKNDPPGSVAA